MQERDGIDWKTKKPLFNSDEEYNDYVTKWKEAKEYQEKTYGYIGWYDANCNYFYGCKWDCDFDYFEITHNENDIIEIEIAVSTPWSMPTLWLKWIKETFDLNVYICAFEESNMFNTYGEIGCDDTIKELELPQYNEDTDIDWEEYYMLIEHRKDKFTKEFFDWVRKQ